MPDIENPFFSELAKAIEKEAYEQEYRILLCNSDDQKEKELANLQMLAQLQADGVILMTNTGEKSQSYEAVSMPIVFVTDVWMRWDRPVLSRQIIMQGENWRRSI